MCLGSPSFFLPMVVLLKPNWFWTIHGNLRAQADYQPIVREHHHAYKLWNIEESELWGSANQWPWKKVSYEVQPSSDLGRAKSYEGGTKLSEGNKICNITWELLPKDISKTLFVMGNGVLFKYG